MLLNRKSKGNDIYATSFVFHSENLHMVPKTSPRAYTILASRSADALRRSVHLLSAFIGSIIRGQRLGNSIPELNVSARETLWNIFFMLEVMKCRKEKQVRWT